MKRIKKHLVEKLDRILEARANPMPAKVVPVRKSYTPKVYVSPEQRRENKRRRGKE